MPAATLPEPVSLQQDKKSKKSNKSEKKRSREDDGVADTEPRKHKKSKSVSAAALEIDDIGNVDDTTEKKKKKKSSKHEGEAADKSEKKKHKKKHADGEEKAERKKKKSKKDEDADGDEEKVDVDEQDIIPQSPIQSAQKNDDADADAMDIDDEPAVNSVSSIHQPPDIPSKPQFPFFSQTVSLYEPIYPNGWAQPVTGCEFQYLRHLQNKYVPSLKGVLMSYTNVTLGDEPSRDGAATNDEEMTTLKSQREYGVGFGWITADVQLFMPTRGAWMEGSVNLQTEGHIGVVCFGRFNASIEARRLPPSWKWVSNEDAEAEGMEEETASVVAPDEHGVVHQIHSTGFWVDASGDKIQGRIRFRIRNFDVGVSGETTYLSLEGTMLDKGSEKTLVQQEAEAIKMRRSTKTNRRLDRRRAPEFSMTRFFSEEEKQAQEEREAARAAERAAAAAEAETAAAASTEGTKIVFDD